MTNFEPGKKTAAALSLYFTILGSGIVEQGLYRAFEQENGDNLICDIDPTCRRLNDDEIFMARSMFGDAIDYDQVKIISRMSYDYLGILILKPHKMNVINYVKDNGIHAIYNGPAYDPERSLFDLDKIFIHEMTHIFQHQNDIPHGDYPKYDYVIEDGKPFTAYGVEQQARIIEVTYALRSLFQEAQDTNTMPHGKLQEQFCTNLTRHENLVSQVLAFDQTTDCDAAVLV